MTPLRFNSILQENKNSVSVLMFFQNQFIFAQYQEIILVELNELKLLSFYEIFVIFRKIGFFFLTQIIFQDATPSHYYAVFDGHDGEHAAVYSANHLHQYLAESTNFTSNPEEAIKDAFCKTDSMFIKKTETEVREPFSLLSKKN